MSRLKAGEEWAYLPGRVPATHLFLCSGYIQVDAARIVQESGMINMMPDAPLPFSFLLPDNNLNSYPTPLRKNLPSGPLRLTFSEGTMEREYFPQFRWEAQQAHRRERKSRS
jgi:hypothetical protein